MKFNGLNLLKQIDPAKPIPSAKFIPGDRNIYMLISRAMITIVITLVFVLFTGCLGQKQHLLDPFEQENKSNETGKTNEKEFSNKETDPIKKRIDEMTLEEKIGQMVIVGFEGSILNDILKSLIYDYCVSGFIFYERNIENSNQLLELTNSLKKENEKANNVPIFLSIDEEGGRVSRIPKDIKNLPSNGVIGKINDGSLSYKIGKTIGEKTKIFGFNMDFAPVLDINNNPNNPVIGDRAFGDNENIVSKLGVQTMKGLQAEGIISVVKHFPGHGNTATDSHMGLPTMDFDLEKLLSFEIVPFKTAISNGADIIMTAHILIPKIDSEKPASLSKKIITGILREELGFNGVVITDDITMGAINENFCLGEAAIESIIGGTDIILISHGYENIIQIIEALKEAARTKTLSISRIDESLYRILKLKEKYSLIDEEKNSVNLHNSIENTNKAIIELLETIDIFLQRSFQN